MNPLLITMCDFHWLLPWIIPFLLGIGLGWAIWAHWRKKYHHSEDELAKTTSLLKETEDRLQQCKKERSQLDGELTASKGQIRELVQENKHLRTKMASAPTVEPIAIQKSKKTPSKKKLNPPRIITSNTKFRRVKQDDLTIIEGIGPKIAAVLQNARIDTWALLSATSPEKIVEILKNSGGRFSLAKPKTWPKQALLADQGKWEELEKYQDLLHRGE